MRRENVMTGEGAKGESGGGGSDGSGGAGCGGGGPVDTYTHCRAQYSMGWAFSGLARLSGSASFLVRPLLFLSCPPTGVGY